MKVRVRVDFEKVFSIVKYYPFRITVPCNSNMNQLS